MRGKANPIFRYWRGGYPLAVSFWVFNVALGLVVELVALAAILLFSPEASIAPALAFLIAALAAIPIVCAMAWVRVGAWCAANWRAGGGTAMVWGVIARILVVLPGLFDAGIVLAIGFTLVGFYPIAFLGDPTVPGYSVRVSADGHTLEVSGGMKFGLAGDMQAALAAAPGVTTVSLTSGGGRNGAAEQVAELIAGRGLDTYVPKACLSACTIAFVAGRNRVLRQGARLGFHGGSAGGIPVPKAMMHLADVAFGRRFIDAGVDPEFMHRVYSVPNSRLWVPTPEELMDAHVITSIAP